MRGWIGVGDTADLSLLGVLQPADTLLWYVAINRIERELDQQRGTLKKPQPLGKTKKHQSLDAVVATSGLLVVVAFAIVFGGRLNVTQRAALTGGVLGGAAGLLVGYGVGRIR